MVLKNLYLKVASIIVFVVAFAYGISPNSIIPLLFDFEVVSIDMYNLLRAMMGLYFCFACYWMYASINEKYYRNATLTCVIFMGGLAFGRIISIVMDGIPSIAFVIGLIGEVFLMVWGLFNLKMA